MFARVPCAALFGALTVLGWEPYGVVPMLWLGYLGLFVLLYQATLRSHMLLMALSFALAQHAWGHSWLFPAMLYQTQLGWTYSIVGFAVFLMYMCIYQLVCVWVLAYVRSLIAKCNQHSLCGVLGFVLAVASCFTLSEFARSLFFSGLTTLSAGYAFVDGFVAEGWMPVLGAYGTSFGFYGVAASLAVCCATAMQIPIGVWNKRQAYAGWVVFLIAGSVFWLGGAYLSTVQWVEPYGKPLTYSLLQTGVEQADKFDPRKVATQIKHNIEMIANEQSHLIVAPETTFPVFANELHQTHWQQLQQHSKNANAHVFFGMATGESDGKAHNTYFNVSPNGSIQQYHKVLLTPLGEYTPSGLGKFANAMEVPWQDLDAGSNDQNALTVHVGGKRHALGVMICQEDLVGEQAIKWGDKVGILLNPSNLAWFDGTIAIKQRTQVAQSRAIETGRSVLRAVNTGETMHINHKGKIDKQAPMSEVYVLRGSVQAMKGKTPFVSWGNAPVATTSLMFLFCVVITCFFLERLKICYNE